jgi:hypothetical protein
VTIDIDKLRAARSKAGFGVVAVERREAEFDHDIDYVIVDEYENELAVCHDASDPDVKGSATEAKRIAEAISQSLNALPDALTEIERLRLREDVATARADMLRSALVEALAMAARGRCRNESCRDALCVEGRVRIDELRQLVTR